MSDVFERNRKRLARTAGSFAAVIATGASGGRSRIKMYDFRALYLAWPASGMPSVFSRPTKVVAGEVNHKDNFYD